jgi:hypothetical protein
VLAERSFVMFLRFRVDFDRQRDVVKKLKVELPGTILGHICYEEIGRIVGATDDAAIRKLLEKTQVA